MFVPVQRAAVHKRIKEGKLTAFFFYITQIESTFFGTKRKVKLRPYIVLSVSECKAWAAEMKRRMGYAPEEIQRLLAVAGRRVPVYLVAALPGIRRGEIKQLRWADVKLDGTAPKITVPAAISKNHYEDALPLHPDLVAALKQIKPASSKPEQLIFKGKFPGYKQFYADLKAAGIDWEDHGDGRLDFHSFRVTYCTQLAPGTPSERVRMAPMRHRDPKQTAKTYTDARMLPLKEAIAKLSFHRSPGSSKDDTQLDTQNSVAACQNGSFAVTPH